MGSALRTIANFLTPEDAEVARLALTEQGISTYLENATTVGMVWAWGNATGWVKLQVAEADVDRARAVLAQKNAAGEPPHICPKCGAEVPPGFEICWSCQAPLDVENEPQAAQSAVAEKPEDEPDAEPEDVLGDGLARRALYAAILGMFTCPPLFNGYSIWLVLRIAFEGMTLTPKGDRTYRWAVGINLLVACLWGSFFLTRALH